LGTHPDGVPEVIRRFLTGIDFRLLDRERSGRIRNLRGHILRACPSLDQVCDLRTLTELTEALADSDLFWSSIGRSLAENFCLFVATRRKDALSSFALDVVRLNGVVSGLRSGSLQPSPWPENAFHLDALDGSVRETLAVSHQLVDDAGNLPNAENLELVRSVRCQRISVVRTGDGRIIAIAERFVDFEDRLGFIEGPESLPMSQVCALPKGQLSGGR